MFGHSGDGRTGPFSTQPIRGFIRSRPVAGMARHGVLLVDHLVVCSVNPNVVQTSAPGHRGIRVGGHDINKSDFFYFFGGSFMIRRATHGGRHHGDGQQAGLNQP